MTEPTPERPRQVTLAAWLIMVGSAIVVAMVFERISGLGTLETQESIQDFLSTPPGSDLGIGVDGVVSLLRTTAMVAAGCATAAGILGYQVLRRSKSARLALTVLAAPLFVTGMVTGGFVSSLVAASAVMLWLQPARDWFRDGTMPAPRPARPAVAAPARGLSTSSTVGFGSTTVPVVTRRPPAVVWACVLTWILCGLVAFGVVVSAITIALDPEVILDEVHRQNPDLAARGVTDSMLEVATYVMAAGIVLWCVGAAAMAVLVYRRVAWARIVLIVSASVAAGLSLIGTAVGGFALVFPLVGGAVTIALLLRRDSRPWFDRPSG
ncbi:hypothetical protein ABLE68_10345 [Nocardioides sp. CN2-186]|uniref:hypothetical protein n=1 Tax=Nocardioides tweenelious TaxID=3156607 RepID=UPI0032B61408